MELTDDQLGGICISVWFLIVCVNCAVCFQIAKRPVWPAFVPGLNAVHLCHLAGISGWWAIGICVPLVNMLIPLYIAIRLARRFGWSELMGIPIWMSGFTLLIVLAIRDYRDDQEFVDAQTVSPSANVMRSDQQVERSPQSAITLTRIRMIVLTVGYLFGLICLPGAMIVGVMAFGGATADQVERGKGVLALFALTPISLLTALIGGWILHARHKFWAASSMAALPVLNVFAVIVTYVWVMSR